MSDTNKVVFFGRLVRDAEVKDLKSDTKVANFSVANNRAFGSGDDRKEEVTFLDCEMFGKKAGYFAEKTQKGSRVLLEGRLRQNTYENKEGNTVSKIVLNVDDYQIIDYKPNSESDQKQDTKSSSKKSASTKGKFNKTDDGDDVPF